MSAVEVGELTVNYDKTSVLWDISFSIPEEKIVAILGPNGAGKSTLLKAMLGLVRPANGRISFFGDSLKKVRSRVAYVPQRVSVDWDFPITALDLVMMGRYKQMGLLKWASKKDREATYKALEMVDMAAFAKRQIGQLSGGQQQRLFIARALVQEADLYLLDEPFAGIDMATEKELIKLFETIRSQGKTIIVVHHDLSSVESYFDWLILLNTCLIASGTTASVFNSPNIARTYGHKSLLFEEIAMKTKSGVLL